MKSNENENNIDVIVRILNDKAPRELEKLCKLLLQKYDNTNRLTQLTTSDEFKELLNLKRDVLQYHNQHVSVNVKCVVKHLSVGFEFYIPDDEYERLSNMPNIKEMLNNYNKKYDCWRLAEKKFMYKYHLTDDMMGFMYRKFIDSNPDE